MSLWTVETYCSHMLGWHGDGVVLQGFQMCCLSEENYSLVVGIVCFEPNWAFFRCLFKNPRRLLVTSHFLATSQCSLDVWQSHLYCLFTVFIQVFDAVFLCELG